MLNRFRSQLGTAGLIVAIVALVAALAGGAIAAQGGGDQVASASKKHKKAKQGKRGKPGKPGKPGPAGPAGPAGPQGPAGTNGTNGTDGANGTNGSDGTDGNPGADGKTVLSGAGDPDDSLDGVNGDFYINTTTDTIFGPKAAGVWPTPGTSLKGADGSPWTAGGTLPLNATETGAWSFSTTQAATGDLGGDGLGENDQLVPISFPVPLAATLNASHAIYVPNNNTTTAHCSASGSSTVTGDEPDGPGGRAFNPKADSGYLCVYGGSSSNAVPSPLASSILGSIFAGVGSSGASVDKSGAAMFMKIPAAGEAYAIGSWAVTG